MTKPGNSKKPTVRPSKPKFALLGIIAGTITGMAFGFAIEMTSHPSPLFMQAGGLAGFVVGLLVESARFWWCSYTYRTNSKKPKLDGAAAKK
jgi:F0F1-type ATP synthase assembly protein I